MRQTLPILILILIAGGLASCDYPAPVRAKKDRFYVGDILNSITGSVTVRGPELEDGTFRAMVILFDANNPGPPDGTGGPVDFAVITPEEFVGDSTFGFRAPFAMTEIADGEYLIDVILDMDGDFSPAAFTLGGATCGDWQGSHFGLNEPGYTTTVTTTDTGGPGTAQVEVPPVFAKGRIVVEGGVVVSGIEALVEQELDTERPAFVVPNADFYQTMSLEAVGNAPTAPPTYTLQSSGIHVAWGEKPDEVFDIADRCTPDGADPRFCNDETTCESAFSVLIRDLDGNGQMDAHPDYPPEFGLKDIWPRVLLEYLGTVEMDGEGKVVRDENGFPIVTPPDLPEGVFWATENFPFGLEAAFGIPVVPLNEPTKMPEITVMFPPLVAKFYDTWSPDCGGEPPEDLSEGCSILYDLSDPAQRAEVPKGVWGINLISHNGQTWGIPNEISEYGLVSTQEGFDPKSQGGFLLTTP